MREKPAFVDARGAHVRRLGSDLVGDKSNAFPGKASTWPPPLTILAAVALAIESLAFVGVHAKYRETTPMISSCLLDLIMAFIAYGRIVLQTIS